jgi:hypothetical protein
MYQHCDRCDSDYHSTRECRVEFDAREALNDASAIKAARKRALLEAIAVVKQTPHKAEALDRLRALAESA